MSDIMKGVLTGVLCTALVSGVGYVFLVKENQIKISNLEKTITKIADSMDDSGESINALKLFVVSAHPSKNYMPLASAKKLGSFKPSEMEILASELMPNEGNKFNVKAVNFSEDLKPIIEKYKLNNEDLNSYFNIVNINGTSKIK